MALSPNWNDSLNQIIHALESNGVKRENGHWRGASPFRVGSDGNAFKVDRKVATSGNHDTLVWTDHKEGTSGGIRELATHFNIALPNDHHEPIITKRAYRDLAEYAQVHGIEPDTLLEAGFREVVYQKRKALEFPTSGGKRWRFLDGESPAYISEKGYKECWYGLDDAIALARRVNLPLILCNGEVTTLVAQSYGLPACAKTAGEKALPVHVLSELKQRWQGKITLAYDCDKAGQDAAQKVAAQLFDYEVAIVDLGLTDGMDLGDFCTLYQLDAYQTFYTRVPEHGKPGLEILEKNAVSDLAAQVNDFTRAYRDEQTRKQGGDLEGVLATLQAGIDRVRSSSAKPVARSMSDAVNEARTRFIERVQNPTEVPGLRMNIYALDKLTGGIQEGTVNIVYGATSMGKSTLITSVIPSLAREAKAQDGLILIVPTETITWKYVYKIAASLCHVDSQKMLRGDVTAEEYHRVLSVLDNLAGYGVEILEASRPTIAQLRATVLAKKALYKCVVIDSISNMATADDYAAVAEVNNGIQELAKGTGIPFLGTSQVGRDVSKLGKGHKRPKLTDGYGGGVIENNADIVIGLYRHQYYVDQELEEPDERFPPDTSAAIMLKNRWGGGVGSFTTLRYISGIGFYGMSKEQS